MSPHENLVQSTTFEHELTEQELEEVPKSPALFRALYRADFFFLKVKGWNIPGCIS